jgi:glycosyltransferase involved in cell wall biosynthesis
MGIAVQSCNLQAWTAPLGLLRLRRLISADKPDLVHSLLFHANLASRVVRRLAGIPTSRLLCEIQTVETQRTWHLALDRWTIASCAVEIGNSQSVVSHLEASGLPKEKLRRINGGIDVRAIQAAEPIPRSELGLSDATKLALWVGRLDPVKGLLDLLRALPKVLDGRQVHVGLAGTGSQEEVLRRVVDELDLGAAVSFLGVRTDVPRLLRTADLFVFPSLTEGLPNALLEAMAARCPIVCTNVPGNRDLIDSDVHGVMVSPDDPAALAAGIIRVCGEPQTAARMAAAAAARVKRDFSQAASIEGYVATYDECLK